MFAPLYNICREHEGVWKTKRKLKKKNKMWRGLKKKKELKVALLVYLCWLPGH